MNDTAPEDAAAGIARAFHEAYERLAPEHGYTTREASARPWQDVPAQNRNLMTATVGRLLADGVIVDRAALEQLAASWAELLGTASGLTHDEIVEQHVYQECARSLLDAIGAKP